MQMREADRIADQLARSYCGQAWHGPALAELLAGIAAGQAAGHPLPNLHSIWEIVLHVVSWHRAAIRALAGKPVPVLPWDEDWPALGDVGDAEWREALDALDQVNRELVAATRQLPDERLDETVPGSDYSVYFLLHGVVQHNLYHAGQIALLKKA